MTVNTGVETANINDIIEFADDLRVRKELVHTDQIVSEIVCYEGGQLTKQHVHPYQDEIFFCVDGEGAITFADPDLADEPITQGSIVFVPAGVRHGVSTHPGQRLVLMFTKGPGLSNPNRKRRAVPAGEAA